jgi:site-specific DNA recombinase
VISGELELLQSDDPTQADLDSIGRGIGEAGRKIGNLTRALAMFGDPEAAAPIVAEIEALRAQQRSLEVERVAVLARRAGWEEGQRRLADLQRWCQRVSTRLGELTYEQKRLALEALGVEVRVWKADHEPRYVITAQLDLEALPKAELEGQPESDLANAPGYMMRPRRQARSGCW